MVRYAKLLVPVLVLVPSLYGFLDNDIHPVITTMPASMFSGSHGTATVTVNQPGITDTTLYISTSNPGALGVPATVYLPAGVTQVQFQVTAFGPSVGTVTASANGYQATSAVVLVVPSS